MSSALRGVVCAALMVERPVGTNWSAAAEGGLFRGRRASARGFLREFEGDMVAGRVSSNQVSSAGLVFDFVVSAGGFVGVAGG